MGIDQEEERRMASLLAARQGLPAGVDKSRALSHALAREGPRLEEIQTRLPVMEAAVRPIRAPREALTAAGPNINRAVGPAAAVLKVFDAVHGLEPPLLARAAVSEDLRGYLAVFARLEEARHFLSDNLGLADIVAYLGERKLADPRFVSDLAEALEQLKNPSADLDGGLLAAALDMLEAEFRRLLAEHSAPLAMKEPDKSRPASIAPSRIPVAVVKELLTRLF